MLLSWQHNFTQRIYQSYSCSLILNIQGSTDHFCIENCSGRKQKYLHHMTVLIIIGVMCRKQSHWQGFQSYIIYLSSTRTVCLIDDFSFFFSLLQKSKQKCSFCMVINASWVSNFCIRMHLRLKLNEIEDIVLVTAFCIKHIG